MRIEPIGAIGSYSYHPYIYNTNRLNRNSLSNVKPIEDDLLSSKTDFTGLVEDKPQPPKQNENPLKPGETVNFAEMLEKQMSEGRRNAARIMRPAGAAASAETASRGMKPQNDVVRMPSGQADGISYQMRRALDAYNANMLSA